MAAKVSDMVAQLERSRQLAAIGEFSAELSHEIRNPLTALKLNLQRIERSVRGGPAAAAAPLAISLREIERLDRVVSGILHLGRPHSGARTVVRLRDMAEQALAVVREQASAQQVEIRTGFAARDDVAVAADGLRAAILNLLVNALEAMPAGGILRLWTERVPPDTEAVALLVEDSGPGVPVPQRDLLFRPFHSTKPQGTGLGLAAALRTAEAHGGSLTLAEPRHGAGAAFRLQLPLAAVEVSA
jgi:signal transduction histidine kinase